MHNNVKALLATTALFFSGQIMANSGCSFEQEQQGFMATCSEEKQEVILTGALDTATLIETLNQVDDGYTRYQVDNKAAAPLKTVTTPTEIVVIIGTWCPDCHRETPRFIRIMEAVNNDNIKVSYIGVDRAKLDEEGLAAKYDFSRIPTFIVMQNGAEIGRIVERPTISLEQDLATILN